MNRIKRWGLAGATTVLIVGTMAGCSLDDQYASSKADTHICIYDGSERGGQKLKNQVAPGKEAVKIDDNDQVVELEMSNRFDSVAVKRTLVEDKATSSYAWKFEPDPTKDPLAPNYYEGFAKGAVKVHVEGQIKFKFNKENPCDWYSNHGRRNANSEGSLGMNCRSPECDPTQAGWFKFLVENFNVTMEEVISENLGTYEWPALVYKYPINADESGVVPDGEDPGKAVTLVLGEKLGALFHERLNANLGGEYFCGINPVDDAEDDPCPSISFQITSIHTDDPALEASRQRLETRRQDLRSQELEGELLEQRNAAILATEKANQNQLAAKLETARLQAQIDNAKCEAIVKLNPNLGCDGKPAQIIVGGN